MKNDERNLAVGITARPNRRMARACMALPVARRPQWVPFGTVLNHVCVRLIGRLKRAVVSAVKTAVVMACLSVSLCATGTARCR